MGTYLLTYNPKLWHWDNIQECIEQIRQSGYYPTSWTCGNTRKIVPGDRLYIIQLGVKRRGIFAAGKATSGVIESEHWIERKRAQGQRMRYVELHLDVLLDPDREPLFPYEKLMDDFPQVRWSPRSSGARIPDEIATRLAAEWERFLVETDARI
jgi:hypothetical protein